MKTAMEMNKMTKKANTETKNIFQKYVEECVTKMCEDKIIHAANNGERSIICEIPRTTIENKMGTLLRGEQIAKDYLTSLGYFVYTKWETDYNCVKTNLVLSIGW